MVAAIVANLPGKQSENWMVAGSFCLRKESFRNHSLNNSTVAGSFSPGTDFEILVLFKNWMVAGS